MKSGASDPFSDDAEEEDSLDSATDDGVHEAGGTAEGGVSADAESSGETSRGTDGNTDESETPGSNTLQINREDLPLTLRRDNVKDERGSVHQLFVQSGTDDRATDAERELESLVDEDVYRLDAREAIYLAGMQNIEDAADVLREWGYDL